MWDDRTGRCFCPHADSVNMQREKLFPTYVPGSQTGISPFHLFPGRHVLVGGPFIRYPGEHEYRATQMRLRSELEPAASSATRTMPYLSGVALSLQPKKSVGKTL